MCMRLSRSNASSKTRPSPKEHSSIPKQVIQTMEDIKQQSATITEQMAKLEDVHQEVEVASLVYTMLSQATTRTYFSMESLGDILFLYRYSLDYFFEIYMQSVKDPSVPDAGATDWEARAGRRTVKSCLVRLLQYGASGARGRGAARLCPLSA